MLIISYFFLPGYVMTHYLYNFYFSTPRRFNHGSNNKALAVGRGHTYNSQGL